MSWRCTSHVTHTGVGSNLKCSGHTHTNFTDDDAINQGVQANVTRVSSNHFEEIKNAINRYRQHYGLAPINDFVNGFTVQNINKLRSEISTINKTNLSWTDSTIEASKTPIKAIHINELRQKMINVEDKCYICDTTCDGYTCRCDDYSGCCDPFSDCGLCNSDSGCSCDGNQTCQCHEASCVAHSCNCYGHTECDCFTGCYVHLICSCDGHTGCAPAYNETCVADPSVPCDCDGHDPCSCYGGCDAHVCVYYENIPCTCNSGCDDDSCSCYGNVTCSCYAAGCVSDVGCGCDGHSCTEKAPCTNDQRICAKCDLVRNLVGSTG